MIDVLHTLKLAILCYGCNLNHSRENKLCNRIVNHRARKKDWWWEERKNLGPITSQLFKKIAGIGVSPVLVIYPSKFS